MKSILSSMFPTMAGRLFAKRFVTPSAMSRRSAKRAARAIRADYERVVPVGGSDISVYIWGDVSPRSYVLLVHGWNSYGLRFAAWINEITARGYAVVAFDQPGHGASSGTTSSLMHFEATLRAVMTLFGTPFAIIGHSLGATSIRLALTDMEPLNRCILLAPFVSSRDAALRLFNAYGLVNKAFSPFEDRLHRITGKRFEDFDLASVLPTMESAALVIHDRFDRATPYAEAQRFATLWNGAHLVTVERKGHDRMLDDPDVIKDALLFLGPA